MSKFKSLIAAGIIFLSYAASAQSDLILFAVCESPRGPALSYGDAFSFQNEALQRKADGFKQDVDGFSNMNPVFYITRSEPNILYSVWGATIPDGLRDSLPDEMTKRSTEKNFIIAHTQDAITAVISYGNESWLVSLFPNSGVGYYSRHKISLDIVNEGYYMTQGAIMASKCDFQ